MFTRSITRPHSPAAVVSDGGRGYYAGMPVHRTKERIEFRVDTPTKRALEEYAHRRGQSLGETIRQLLKKELGLKDKDKMAAAQHLLALGVTGLPEPDQLAAEIERALEGN